MNYDLTEWRRPNGVIVVSMVNTLMVILEIVRHEDVAGACFFDLTREKHLKLNTMSCILYLWIDFRSLLRLNSRRLPEEVFLF